MWSPSRIRLVVAPRHPLARGFFDHGEQLEDRCVALTAPAKIVNFGGARRREEIRTHVVVDAVNDMSLAAKCSTDPMRPLEPVTRIFMAAAAISGASSQFSLGHNILEIRDRLRQTLAQRNAGAPIKGPLRCGDVGPALFRVVFRQGEMNDLRA